MDVDPLSNFEVSWSQAVANRQEVLRRDLELGQVGLGRQVELQEVADLGLVDLMGRLVADANLNRIDAVFLLRFHLGHLASVQLDDGARDQGAPLVPKVGHSDLVADHSGALAIPTRGLRHFQLRILLVDLVLEAAEGRGLVLDTDATQARLLDDVSVVEAVLLCELKVAASEALQHRV